jgi:putative endopeptidase
MLNSITDIGDNILFKFFGKELYGRKKIAPRDERSIMILDNYIGEVVGKEFVSRHFDEESKNIVMDMVDKIKEQMRLSINNSKWMTNQTKEKALLKLGTFKTKIGYPEKWRSYDTLAGIIKLSIEKKSNESDVDSTTHEDV